MIDFHTHILPEIDDGASNVAESVEMLKIEKNQGVNTVVATPHFSLEHISVDDFCFLRETAYNKLIKAINQSNESDFPNIILGAEVKITPHLSKLENISKLCIGDTNLILLEMPYRYWRENWVFDEIFSIIVGCRLVPVIAHIDRYINRRKDLKTLEKLFGMNVKLQVNIDCYNNRHCRKVINSLIKNGNVDVIASDCHNITDRSPDMQEALKKIQKKHGDSVIDTLKKNASSFLKMQK